MSWTDILGWAFPTINFFLLGYILKQRKDKEKLMQDVEDTRAMIILERKEIEARFEARFVRLDSRLDDLMRNDSARRYWDQNKGC